MAKEKASLEITDIIISLISEKNDCVLGLATGSTPLGVYEHLCTAFSEGKVSFKNVKTFNLDEYVGLDGNNKQSYRFFMNHNLFDRIDINKDNTYVPLGVGDYEKYMNEYDGLIEQAGGIDLQILGIGSDGHIAFNEPGTPFESKTHISELAESTIRDNARFFSSINEVPTKAVTMGLQSIMDCKKIVLMAFGANKKDVITRLVKGEVSVDLPASILANHPNVTIYCDEEAAPEI